MTKIRQLAQKLNWKKDDGVFFWMLNDGLRNQFYWDSLEKSAKGKTIIDIGAGAGVLSVMALMAGAKKVIAYEKNRDRYNYALAVFKELGLSDKVDLYHGTFKESPIPLETIDTVVTETFNGDPFEEGFMESLEHLRNFQLAEDFVMIPDRIHMKARLYERSHNEAELFLGPESNLPPSLLNLYNQSLGLTSQGFRKTFLDPNSETLGTPVSSWLSLQKIDFTDIVKGCGDINWSSTVDLPSDPQALLSLLLSWDMESTRSESILSRSDYQNQSKFYCHWNFLKFDFIHASKEPKILSLHLDEERNKISASLGAG